MPVELSEHLGSVFQELLTKATSHNCSFYDFRSRGSLLATVWVDKISIYFVSTIHRAEITGVTVKQRKPDGSQEDVPYPPLLADYQADMHVLTKVTSS